MTTKIIELTDDEIMHIRVALLLRKARLRLAIESLTDAAASHQREWQRDYDTIDALLNGKMRRVGQ